jgi:hypothetical protein
MTAAGELGSVTETLSFALPTLLGEATSFRVGESLVTGELASHAAFVRVGPDGSEEDGWDVPAGWAAGATA